MLISGYRTVEKTSAVLAALWTLSCVDYGDDHIHVDDGDTPPASVAEAPIDPDERIDVIAGEGAGVFIEYESGGVWHLFTTCDTEISDFECEWDVVMSVASTERIDSVVEDDLESDDSLLRIDRGAIRMIGRTAFDFDGVFFEAPPGISVRFDVLLDGKAQPRFVNWVGDGALNRGAPSNPIDLVPSAP